MKKAQEDINELEHLQDEVRRDAEDAEVFNMNKSDCKKC